MASPGITGRGGANMWGPVDGGTEVPERGAEARSAGAPRGGGSGEGRRLLTSSSERSLHHGIKLKIKKKKSDKHSSDL